MKYQVPQSEKVKGETKNKIALRKCVTCQSTAG
jgi:hypothetical protein